MLCFTLLGVGNSTEDACVSSVVARSSPEARGSPFKRGGWKAWGAIGFSCSRVQGGLGDLDDLVQ